MSERDSLTDESLESTPHSQESEQIDCQPENSRITALQQMLQTSEDFIHRQQSSGPEHDYFARSELPDVQAQDSQSQASLPDAE